MRLAPNQSTATLETLMIRMTVGNMTAMSRPARSDVVRELVVGRGETLGLLGLAHEGPHHPDAGDLLAQHPVDLVDALLHDPEGGTIRATKMAEHDGQRRDAHQEHQDRPTSCFSARR